MGFSKTGAGGSPCQLPTVASSEINIFTLINRFPLLSQIFENKMCQTLSKQPENVWTLYQGFTLKLGLSCLV
jgi:hypothetical protein